jgi:hypothetical protein
MAVGDHPPHALNAAVEKRAKELGPELLGLRVTHLQAFVSGNQKVAELYDFFADVFQIGGDAND